MSTSTRNAAKKVWPYELPNYNEEMLARLLFCFENEPTKKGHISGAQDAIGICVSGLCRLLQQHLLARSASRCATTRPC